MLINHPATFNTTKTPISAAIVLRRSPEPMLFPDTNVSLWFQYKHSHKGSSRRGTLTRIVVLNDLQTLHTCPLSPLTPRQVHR